MRLNTWDRLARWMSYRSPCVQVLLILGGLAALVLLSILGRWLSFE